ncbi:2-iminobutanoate/2-iminopropanoate deaminase [Bacilli bacterium PM5-3]|nr:2-iminobutanoate/2-iminopropanoate deaminase [Bacilli bacterium PM5-3]MDH6604032.1 2-iminobutanoate/2-iminopropanoate deaminase [Bacilli bacterium PM5-9]
MSRKIIFSDKAPAALGPYSHAVEANGILFVSGQVPLVPETGEIADGGIQGQTKQSLANVDAILKESGYTKYDVVKATIFISDMNEFPQINEIYGEYFESHKPARACVEVARLPKDVGVEIEVIAIKE